jgi:hypothetical protein
MAFEPLTGNYRWLVESGRRMENLGFFISDSLEQLGDFKEAKLIVSDLCSNIKTSLFKALMPDQRWACG